MAETGERMVGGLGYTGRQRVAGDRRGSTGIEDAVQNSSGQTQQQIITTHG